MGLPAGVDFSGQTTAAVRKMIGNAMHTSCVGHALGVAVLVRCGLLGRN